VHLTHDALDTRGRPVRTVSTDFRTDAHNHRFSRSRSGGDGLRDRAVRA
jgi:hypothetical protein